jgi:hypothetical protein
MKKITYHNTEKITKVDVFDFTITEDFVYCKEIKIFNIVFRKKGFYEKGIFLGTDFFIGNSLPATFVNKNDVIYKKPFVRIFFNNVVFVKYFSTLNNAMHYAEEICKDKKFICDVKI